MTRQALGWPLVALAAMVWGSDVLLRSAVVRQGLSPALIVLLEHAALTVLFLPVIVAYRGAWRRVSRREWAGLVYIAWAGSAVATVLLTLAYKTGNPLTATLLQKTQPVFAVALAGVLLGEKRAPLFWALFGGAILATYLLSFGFTSPAAALASPSAPAALYALGAAALWGSCTVVGRIALRELPPAVVAGARFALALPLLAAINAPALLAHHALPMSGAGPHGALVAALPALAVIVLLPDALGMVLYYVGLRRTPASLATIAELAYPLSALLFGVVFAHLRLSAGQWIGFAALIASLQLIEASHGVRVPPPAAPLPYRGDGAPGISTVPAPVQET